MDSTNDTEGNAPTAQDPQPQTVPKVQAPVTPQVSPAQPVNGQLPTSSGPIPVDVAADPSVVDSATPAIPTVPRKKLPLLLISAAVAICLITGVVGFLLGSGRNRSAQSNTTGQQTSEVSELTIPQGATVIAQCAKGRGTQYALPKDIPTGPVYNVHEGKVIGIEFMVGREDLTGANSKSFLNLPLSNVKYDHVNIGLLSQGHAGFPSPHYHVDIMMVPTSVTEKITCT